MKGPRKRGAAWIIAAHAALGAGCAAARVAGEPGPVAPLASAAPDASVPLASSTEAPAASTPAPASSSAAPAASSSGGGEAAQSSERLEQLAGALQALQKGGDGAACKASYEAASRLLAATRVPEGDPRFQGASPGLYQAGASCAARAGDCATAWQIFLGGYPKESLANVKEEEQRKGSIKLSFGSMNPGCKGKAP
jgi:hypothetical protein